jgi:uncharacterized membrane-anchored protein YhcB (DUF1043 family)
MEIWQIVIYGLVCAAVGLVLGIKIGQIILANKLLPKIKELQTYIEELQRNLKLVDNYFNKVKEESNGEE